MSRFDGVDIAEMIMPKTNEVHATIGNDYDPYEVIRQTVARLCVYIPENDMLQCSISPQNVGDIGELRRKLRVNTGMQPRQIDNGFSAAFVSILHEQRGFYEEASTGINVDIGELHDR